jgi:hypothetical protein
LGLARGVRELDGELEDTLRSLRHLIGFALRLVCCGDGSIFYVAVGGRVLGVGRGLVGFGGFISLLLKYINGIPIDTVGDFLAPMPCADDYSHLMLTSLLAAMMKSRESALEAEKG